MAFSKRDIISSDKLFCGLSRGAIVTLWWNYIITTKGGPPQPVGKFLFLLGNVEGQTPPLPPQPPISVLSDTAVFFPVLCEIIAFKDFESEITAYDGQDSDLRRRTKMQNILVKPPVLKVSINGYKLNGLKDLSEYYVESPDFIFDVPKPSDTLRMKFAPVIKTGSSRAVAGGFYLLLKPPNKRTTYKIKFEGENSNGYRTEAEYTVIFN